MGSTFVDFRDKGFEANDSTLEVWLALLVDEINRLPAPPDWLREVRDDWETSATAHFGYGVMPCLDEAAANDTQRLEILSLASAALKRLESLGDPITSATLNSIRSWGEGFEYPKAMPAIIFIRPARYFIKLLEGRLLPEERDARFAAKSASSGE